MKEYRDRVNAQHAPQELIEQTIQSIHEANPALNQMSLPEDYKKLHRQKVKRRIAAVTAAAACFAACLIIYIGIAVPSRFSYNQVSDIMFRDRLSEINIEELDLQEYEEYLGTELMKLPSEYEPAASKIYVKYDEESRSILADEGTFYLYPEAEGSVVILKTSKSGLEIPEELLSGEGTEINGTTVYVGENAQNKQLLAAFCQEDVEYYLICNDMSKKQFEKLLEELF